MPNLVGYSLDLFFPDDGDSYLDAGVSSQADLFQSDPPWLECVPKHQVQGLEFFGSGPPPT